MMEELIGSLAAICTTVAFIPQAVMVWKTKNTSSISFLMYSVFLIGVILWTVYGLLTHQRPLIFANLITFLFALSIWWQKVLNMRRGEKNV